MAEMNDAASRPTRRGRNTLAAIQNAARTVIGRKGFLNMTIGDITAEAGKSPASFYNYYDSKEDMLRQWAAEFREEARQRTLPGYDHSVGPRDRIVGNVRAHWSTYGERLAEMISIQQFTMVNAEFAALWKEHCAEAVGLIGDNIRRAQRDGYCPGADPLLLASAIVAMLNQFAYVWLAQGGEAIEMDFDDERAIETLADIWYRAVYWT